MIKKATPAKARKGVKAKKRKSGAKTRALSQRALTIQQRLQSLGMMYEASEDFLAIQIEIDRTSGQGARPAPGEVAAKIRAARLAFEDAILNSDDPQDWTTAARKAAGLQ